MTVQSNLIGTVADLADRLFAANQELSLLMRDREAMQSRGAPSTSHQIDALAQYFALRNLPLAPSYLAFLTIHNGWDGFVADSKILSTDDHRSDWVQSAIAQRQGLGSYDPMSHLVPVLLGISPSSPAAFLDPLSIGADSEPEVLAVNDRQGVVRLPSFLALLQEYLALIENAVRQQLEGD